MPGDQAPKMGHMESAEEERQRIIRETLELSTQLPEFIRRMEEGKSTEFGGYAYGRLREVHRMLRTMKGDLKNMDDNRESESEKRG